MAKTHDAKAYLQIEPELGNWTDTLTGERAIRGVKAVRLTKTKPIKPVPGTVTVKVTIRVPEAAFLPLRPEAIIEIPEHLTIPNPIEATASDPSQEES